ncbi:hypothetical protein QFZ99_007570 [Paraburkholderia atlantica]
MRQAFRMSITRSLMQPDHLSCLVGGARDRVIPDDPQRQALAFDALKNLRATHPATSADNKKSAPSTVLCPVLLNTLMASLTMSSTAAMKVGGGPTDNVPLGPPVPSRMWLVDASALRPDALKSGRTARRCSMFPLTGSLKSTRASSSSISGSVTRCRSLRPCRRNAMTDGRRARRHAPFRVLRYTPRSRLLSTRKHGNSRRMT